jgi:hypothetical protein
VYEAKYELPWILHEDEDTPVSKMIRREAIQKTAGASRGESGPRLPNMRMLMRIRTALGIGLGIIGLAWPADAGFTTYTDQASFSAATTGLTNINFNGHVSSPTTFIGYAIPSGYTDAATGTNFTFTNSVGDDINITGRNYYGTNYFSTDTLNYSSSIPPTAAEVITLPGSARAFSLMFSSYNISAPVTFTLSNGDSYTAPTSSAFGTVDFLGFTDTTAFTSVTISSHKEYLLSVSYQGSAVPEPSSLILMAFPLALLAARAGIVGCRGRYPNREVRPGRPPA